MAHGTWMKRSTDGTKAVIGCKGTEESWELKCEKGKWVGKTENCTQGETSLEIDYDMGR